MARRLAFLAGGISSSSSRPPWGRVLIPPALAAVAERRYEDTCYDSGEPFHSTVFGGD